MYIFVYSFFKLSLSGPKYSSNSPFEATFTYTQGGGSYVHDFKQWQRRVFTCAGFDWCGTDDKENSSHVSQSICKGEKTLFGRKPKGSQCGFHWNTMPPPAPPPFQKPSQTDPLLVRSRKFFLESVTSGSFSWQYNMCNGASCVHAWAQDPGCLLYLPYATSFCLGDCIRKNKGINGSNVFARLRQWLWLLFIVPYFL